MSRRSVHFRQEYGKRFQIRTTERHGKKQLEIRNQPWPKPDSMREMLLSVGVGEYKASRLAITCSRINRKGS